jgi:ubiquinone/menaquinone biosynthesis C-methylase UbiE
MQKSTGQIRLDYNQWSAIYDTNINRTRDLEAVAIRELLKGVRVNSSLEVGCGTGKNTMFLQDVSASHLAVDIAEDMLQQAINKVDAPHVRFQLADITRSWDFVQDKVDLVTFSLVLEHIADLEDIFQKLANVLPSGGMVYIGELHPFKQYAGTKARFEVDGAVKELVVFTHHVSDFVNAALAAGFEMMDMKEYFDEGDNHGIPRILALVFQKK